MQNLSGFDGQAGMLVAQPLFDLTPRPRAVPRRGRRGSGQA